jgi:hypothetical protein
VYFFQQLWNLEVITKATYSTLSWASSIQFAPSHVIPLRSIIQVTHIRFAFMKVTTYIEQEVLGKTNRVLYLIWHGPHWKRCVQQFFYCVCIRYRGNISTEPLPSNNRGIFTEPSHCLAMMGGYTYTDDGIKICVTCGDDEGIDCIE